MQQLLGVILFLDEEIVLFLSLIPSVLCSALPNKLLFHQVLKAASKNQRVSKHRQEMSLQFYGREILVL